MGRKEQNIVTIATQLEFFEIARAYAYCLMTTRDLHKLLMPDTQPGFYIYGETWIYLDNHWTKDTICGVHQWLS